MENKPENDETRDARKEDILPGLTTRDVYALCPIDFLETVIEFGSGRMCWGK
jgi:hypothetical protein